MAHASKADVEPRGRRRPRRASPRSGRSSRAASGRSTCTASRGSSRSARREFAVVESMNSGKPIKESRDVDVPLAAAHFFYYAGWADKLEYAFPNREPRSLGVAAQVIPWNFPLLMLAWKIAPALAAGNTVILKPASTTPLTAYLFADVVRQAELPPGVVNIITGPGEIGMELVTHPDVSKVAFTGSTAVGKMIARAVAGSRQEGHARARRQGREHRLRRCAARPGDRGHHQRHLLQPGRGLLRRLAPVRAGERLRAADRQAQGAPRRRCASATRSTRTPTSAPSTRPGSWPRSQELVESGIAEGAEIFQPDCELPDPRLLLPPDPLHRRQPEPPDRAGGDLRPGPVGPHLPHAGGGDREGEQHALRPLRRRLDREGQPHLQDDRRHEGRRGVGQHLQPLRPDLAVRRLQGVRLRPRGRHPRPGRLPRPVRSTGRTADEPAR